MQSNINQFGAAAMAGCGAHSRIEGFGFLPVTCFTMALTTFVSQNLGAKAYDRVKKGIRVRHLLLGDDRGDRRPADLHLLPEADRPVHRRRGIHRLRRDA